MRKSKVSTKSLPPMTSQPGDIRHGPFVITATPAGFDIGHNLLWELLSERVTYRRNLRRLLQIHAVSHTKMSPQEQEGARQAIV